MAKLNQPLSGTQVTAGATRSPAQPRIKVGSSGVLASQLGAGRKIAGPTPGRKMLRKSA